MNVPNHNLIIKEIKYFQSFSNIKYFMTLTWNYLENYRLYYEVYLFTYFIYYSKYLILQYHKSFLNLLKYYPVLHQDVEL